MIVSSREIRIPCLHGYEDTTSKTRPLTAERSPRRIAFGINGRFLSQRITGVQRYALEITKEMDDLLFQQGLTAELYLPNESCLSKKFKAIDQVVIKPLSGLAWEQCTLATNIGLPLLNLCNLAPAFRKEQVTCLHDANVYKARSSYDWRFSAFYRSMMPVIARRSTYLTTVSDYSARDLAKYLGISRQRFAIIPNGHEHALRWQRSKATIQNRYVFPRPFVLLVGSLAPHKNINIILSLAQVLDEWAIDIVVVGSYSGPYRAMGFGGSENVHFLNDVDDNDLAFLMGGALCLAFPSLQEGFGLPIIEAMTLGCPVVASTASCIPEIAGKAALLVAPMDKDAWLIAFKNLVQESSVRDNLRDKGLQNAKRFSWRSSAASYLQIMLGMKFW